MAALEPADLTRCQGEEQHYNPFIMGGKVRQFIRCTNTPSVVVTEKTPGPDGLLGEMSLCGTCLAAFFKEDNRDITVERLTPSTTGLQRLPYNPQTELALESLNPFSD